MYQGVHTIRPLRLPLWSYAVTDRDLTKTYNRAQFVAKLRRLADAIESNKAFTIQVAGEKLRVPADAEFNVEHERSGDQQELEFQVIWAAE
jgi:amphi-Trp domain-containing protein